MDIETYTLPNAMTIPGVVTGLAFSIAIAPDGGRLGTLARAVLTAAIFCLAFLTARWLYWILRKSEGMGLGDIKMIALLSVFLLFAHTALALFIAIMTAALYSLALLIFKKADGGRARIPFGAFLAVGGVASAFFGSEILGWYLGLIR